MIHFFKRTLQIGIIFSECPDFFFFHHHCIVEGSQILLERYYKDNFPPIPSPSFSKGLLNAHSSAPEA